MPSVLVLQHVECEDVGSIKSALDSRGVGTTHVRTYQGDPVPRSLGEHRGLIVMGGPMSVYAQDRYPHLTDELRLIQKTVGEGAPVLGICLGSQLMAEALGGKVAKGKSKEIGWYLTRLSACASKDPIFSALPQEFMAFHWHGDVFTLPPGAEPLASSELTPLQAFRYGRGAYAILFHLEVTPAGIQGMLDTFAEEIRQEGLSAEDIQRAVDKYAAATSSLGAGVFEGWTNLVLRAASSSR